MMDALEFFGRAVLALSGLTAAIRFHDMANHSERAPWLMKYGLYAVASGAGAWVFACAIVPGQVYLLAALWGAVVALSLVLIIDLILWRAGMKACEIMDHAESLKAAKKMLHVVGAAQDQAIKDSEWLTPKSREYLWAQEDQERAKR